MRVMLPCRLLLRLPFCHAAMPLQHVAMRHAASADELLLRAMPMMPLMLTLLFSFTLLAYMSIVCHFSLPVFDIMLRHISLDARVFAHARCYAMPPCQRRCRYYLPLLLLLLMLILMPCDAFLVFFFAC